MGESMSKSVIPLFLLAMVFAGLHAFAQDKPGTKAKVYTEEELAGMSPEVLRLMAARLSKRVVELEEEVTRKTAEISRLEGEVRSLKVVAASSATKRTEPDSSRTAGAPVAAGAAMPKPLGEPGPHFRNVSWGDWQDRVMKVEGGVPAVKKADQIEYHDLKCGEFDAAVRYDFIDNACVRGYYFITEEHTDFQLFYIDYLNLQKALTSKYGRPAESQEKWIEDMFKDDRNKWGTAVAAGHVWFQTIWRTPATEICLSLTGDNLEVNHQVRYTSLYHKDILDKRREDSQKKGL